MGLNFSFSMKSPAEVSITAGFAIKMLSSTRRAILTLMVSGHRDDHVAIYVERDVFWGEFGDVLLLVD